MSAKIDRCKCFECNQLVNWIAEINIYPQRTDPGTTDYYTRACISCLKTISEIKEIKERMTH